MESEEALSAAFSASARARAFSLRARRRRRAGPTFHQSVTLIRPSL